MIADGKSDIRALSHRLAKSLEEAGDPNAKEQPSASRDIAGQLAALVGRRVIVCASHITMSGDLLARKASNGDEVFGVKVNFCLPESDKNGWAVVDFVAAAVAEIQSGHDPMIVLRREP